MNGRRNGKQNGKAWLWAVVGLALLGSALLPQAPVAAADKPTVTLSTAQAGKGGSVTVKGAGWRPRALLMMLICGQSAPGRGVVGGTNSCANAEGRAVTTGKDGTFRKKLPVAEPPEPCPCVVHVATVTGEKARADAAFKVAGHPVKPLPEQTGGGRLSVLTDTRMEGSGSLLTWFGAPPRRTLVFTVGNVGPAPVKDPVFQVGTSHGVFAPQWEEQQWRGTVAPGKKARIELPVELSAGAHGDYLVSLKFGGKVLAEQPWGVGRPWGVTVFWILLCLVVPAAVFRLGMAVVDRLRPRRRRAGGRHRTGRVAELADRLPRLRLSRSAVAADEKARAPRVARSPGGSGGHGPGQAERTTALPWFTPDTDPGAPAGRLSAPSDNSPTKGNT
ncbi:hypothetical protein [Streptomyces sp. NPDC015345]|uniref:hypothetical protein n=1 Tax=Streptomyces sp. NPDC015345 TaxID=3364953 RepID=UPI0036F6C54A